ncbi:MAG: hypothetical protein ACUVQ1_05810 [Candidatus Kapaibacteriales bacterium]
MKIKEFYKELTELAISLGYTIRRDNGNFRGGACILNKEKIIVLNKNFPLEYQANILSNAIYQEIQSKFIKPELRERIEKEVDNGFLTPIQIIVNNEEKEK